MKVRTFFAFVVTLAMTLGVVGCVDHKEEGNSDPAMIVVSPTSIVTNFDGGVSSVAVTSNATWVVSCDQTDVIITPMMGSGNATVNVEIPAATVARNFEIKFTASKQMVVADIPVPSKKEAVVSVSQNASGTDLNSYVYYEDCGTDVEKDGEYWPYVDKYAGWNPQGDGQEGVTYSGNNASVRASGANYQPTEDAMGVSGQPYAFINKTPDGAHFMIQNITVKGGSQYIFNFNVSCQNGYSGTPTFAEITNDLVHLELGYDGKNWIAVKPNFSANGGNGWYVATTEFKTAADATTLFARFTYEAPASNGGCRLDDFKLIEGGLGAELAPEEVVATETNIAGITAVGEYVVKGAWAVAEYANGVLLTDSSKAYILAYSPSEMPAVGKVLDISGAVTEYGGLLQFGKGAVVTLTGDESTVSHPEPVAMDGAQLDEYIGKPSIKYVSYVGKLAIKDSKYYNVTVSGAKVAIGSIQYPTEVMKTTLTALDGKYVKVTGYLIGVSSSMYTNTMAISVEETEATEEPENPENELPFVAGTFYKVTAAETDWTGNYLIVFDANAHATVVGKDLTATVSDLTITENKIVNTEAINKAVLRVAANGSNYTIMLPSGAYLSNAKNSCAISTTPFDWTIEYTEGGVKLGNATPDAANSNAVYYLYKQVNGDSTYYRCYVEKTQDNYTLPTLYKFYPEGTSPETPEQPEPTPGVKTLPYIETFATSQGDFTINNVNLGGLDGNVWAYKTYEGSGYMNASAYVNDTRYATESWLVSPSVSLSGATAPELTFSHTHKFAGTPSEELTLWVSENDGVNWAQVTIPTYGTNSDWTFVDTTVDFTAYAGKTIKFAFKYTSTTSTAATWEIKNVQVAEKRSEPTPNPEPTPGVKNFPYTETFATSQGDFTINDVNLGDLDGYVWSYSTKYTCMKASAYVNNTKYATVSWLVSPSVSLSGATAPELTFDHAHCYAGTPSEELTLWVSEDNCENWTQVVIPTYTANSDYTFTNVVVDLSSFAGKTINVGFKYVSTTSTAATWEIKNFSIAEKGAVVEPEPEPEAPITGEYASDAAFVDSSNNYKGDSMVNGSTEVNANGFKIGTSKLTGYFASQPVGVEGDLTLEFYAVAWKGKSATLYVRKQGSTELLGQFVLNANVGANNQAPYTMTLTDNDHYSVKVPSVTANTVLEFSTDSSFSKVSNESSGRAIVLGVHLK